MIRFPVSFREQNCTSIPYLWIHVLRILYTRSPGTTVCWPFHVTRSSMLRTVFRLYRSRPCGTVRVFAGPLRIESPEAVAVEFDGDPQGTLPAEITVAPRRLRLLK